MVEVARRGYADPEERRWRVMGAYLLLDGRTRPSRRDWALVDGEISAT